MREVFCDRANEKELCCSRLLCNRCSFYCVYRCSISGLWAKTGRDCFGETFDSRISLQHVAGLFFVHIATGSIALLTGPFQFLRSSRKVISVHRIMGRIYGISIFVSVPAGIYLALYTTGGLASSIGFIVLDVAWFMTAFLGLKRIREKR